MRERIKQVLKEYFTGRKQGWKMIGRGTEGEVYTDGTYAYKVVPHDLVPEVERIKALHTNRQLPNVVNVIDAWADQDDPHYTVIQMELLQDLDLSLVDRDEYDDVHEDLFGCEDRVELIPNVINRVDDPELKKMVTAFWNAAQQLKTAHLDIGFHNLMQDPVTKEYKIIDIF